MKIEDIIMVSLTAYSSIQLLIYFGLVIVLLMLRFESKSNQISRTAKILDILVCGSNNNQQVINESPLDTLSRYSRHASNTINIIYHDFQLTILHFLVIIIMNTIIDPKFEYLPVIVSLMVSLPILCVRAYIISDIFNYKKWYIEPFDPKT